MSETKEMVDWVSLIFDWHLSNVFLRAEWTESGSIDNCLRLLIARSVIEL